MILKKRDSTVINLDVLINNLVANIAATLVLKQQKVLEFCYEPRNSREILEYVGVSQMYNSQSSGRNPTEVSNVYKEVTEVINSCYARYIVNLN